MSWNQVHDADMSVGYTGGWCLKYVQDAFHTDHPYATALDEWNSTSDKNHTDRPPAGITVPIFFSLGNVPAGHVAIALDDGWVASSTQPGDHSTPYYHKSIDDLMAVYGQYNGGCTYLGWSEVVGSEQVVEFVPDVVNATDEQIQQAYQDILERPADPDGLAHYRQYPIDFVRSDLQASAEYQALQQHKADLADAQAADAAAIQAAADAKAKADADAAAKLQTETDAHQAAAQDQPAPNPVVAPIHNPTPAAPAEPTPISVDVPPSESHPIPVTSGTPAAFEFNIPAVVTVVLTALAVMLALAHAVFN